MHVKISSFAALLETLAACSGGTEPSGETAASPMESSSVAPTDGGAPCIDNSASDAAADAAPESPLARCFGAYHSSSVEYAVWLHRTEAGGEIAQSLLREDGTADYRGSDPNNTDSYRWKGDRYRFGIGVLSNADVNNDVFTLVPGSDKK